jgi:hypothetical protein
MEDREPVACRERGVDAEVEVVPDREKANVAVEGAVVAERPSAIEHLEESCERRLRIADREPARAHEAVVRRRLHLGVGELPRASDGDRDPIHAPTLGIERLGVTSARRTYIDAETVV